MHETIVPNKYIKNILINDHVWVFWTGQDRRVKSAATEKVKVTLSCANDLFVAQHAFNVAALLHSSLTEHTFYCIWIYWQPIFSISDSMMTTTSAYCHIFIKQAIVSTHSDLTDFRWGRYPINWIIYCIFPTKDWRTKWKRCCRPSLLSFSAVTGWPLSV